MKNLRFRGRVTSVEERDKVKVSGSGEAEEIVQTKQYVLTIAGKDDLALVVRGPRPFETKVGESIEVLVKYGAQSSLDDAKGEE